MEQHYVDALSTDNEFIVKNLYNTNKAAFCNFAKRYNLRDADIVDVYQDAFIVLRKHAISGKLYEVNSSLKTYLFGIGKHLVYKRLKEYALKTDFNPVIHSTDDEIDEILIEPEKELTVEQQLLYEYFKQLGKSCQQMLTLSFYKGQTNEEIAKLEGYESEAVVRSQKSRCLKTLKELIKKSPRK